MTNEHLVELIPHIESALEDGYPLQLKGDDLRFLLEAIKARLSHEPNVRQWDVPSGWREQTPWFYVGDHVISRNALYRSEPIAEVTEITERGFKYRFTERYNMGPRIGWSDCGETFEPSGYELAALRTNASETQDLKT